MLARPLSVITIANNYRIRSWRRLSISLQNNGQQTERLDRQLREQLETASAHIKLSDDRASSIQQIVKDEVAKIKIPPTIDFSTELMHHKGVIQQWIDGTVKASKPDPVAIREYELEKTLQSKLGAEVQRLEGEYFALVAQIKALSADLDRINIDLATTSQTPGPVVVSPSPSGFNLGWSFSVVAIMIFTLGFLFEKLTTLLHHVRIPDPVDKPPANAPCRAAAGAKSTESNTSEVESPGSSSKRRNKRKSKVK
ncbi:hypothetical protein QOT17_012792 [Balamuthia mandrillaris]